MSFPDSAAVARAEAPRLEPISSRHHEDCPQHPWNDVLDEREDCECKELRAADAADAADARRDREREG